MRLGRCICRWRPATAASLSARRSPASNRSDATATKAGVVLLDLHPAAAVQEGLFDKADNPRRVALMRTVDRLNLRFGRDTVSFAAAGLRRPWKLRREFLSPCYTTAWDELLRV
jgi:hypothetical protein